MPPTDRFVISFAAEPPQEPIPYGRWAERLRVEFFGAVDRIDAGEDDLGDPGEIIWYPDRTYGGRTYVPASVLTSTGFEVYGYVSFVPATAESDATDFQATADYTAETAEANPEWTLDLCEEIIGTWRGEVGKVAQMTLIWGRPLVPRGFVVTAELADLAVDQCVVDQDRFTLIAPDDYRSDTLVVRLYDEKLNELAEESLYAEDDDEA